MIAAEELDKGVLYTSTQICRYIEWKRIFLVIAEKILVMLFICEFAVDFNFLPQIRKCLR